MCIRDSSTTAIIAVTSGIFLLITGLLIAKPILEALDTPEDVIDLAVLYLLSLIHIFS